MELSLDFRFDFSIRVESVQDSEYRHNLLSLLLEFHLNFPLGVLCFTQNTIIVLCIRQKLDIQI